MPAERPTRRPVASLVVHRRPLVAARWLSDARPPGSRSTFGGRWQVSSAGRVGPTSATASVVLAGAGHARLVTLPGQLLSPRARGRSGFRVQPHPLQAHPHGQVGATAVPVQTGNGPEIGISLPAQSGQDRQEPDLSAMTAHSLQPPGSVPARRRPARRSTPRCASVHLLPPRQIRPRRTSTAVNRCPIRLRSTRTSTRARTRSRTAPTSVGRSTAQAMRYRQKPEPALSC